MYSNKDIAALLDENTLDFLLLEYDGVGIQPSQIEDEEMADLWEEASDVVSMIYGKLKPYLDDPEE